MHCRPGRIVQAAWLTRSARPSNHHVHAESQLSDEAGSLVEDSVTRAWRRPLAASPQA